MRLAPFEREVLDAYSDSQHVPPERVVATAVMYYLRAKEPRRAGWRCPTQSGEPGGGVAALDLELGEDIWRTLHNEADAQQVSPESLTRHALLFFLADVDSGRAAAELGRALRDA